MKLWKKIIVSFFIVVAVTVIALIVFSPDSPNRRDAKSQHERLLLLHTASLIRNAVSVYYWQHVDPRTGLGRYPNSIEASMFSDNKIPRRTFGIYTWSYKPENGEVKVGKSFYGNLLEMASKLKASIRRTFQGEGKGKK